MSSTLYSSLLLPSLTPAREIRILPTPSFYPPPTPTPLPYPTPQGGTPAQPFSPARLYIPFYHYQALVPPSCELSVSFAVSSVIIRFLNLTIGSPTPRAISLPPSLGSYQTLYINYSPGCLLHCTALYYYHLLHQLEKSAFSLPHLFIPPLPLPPYPTPPPRGVPLPSHSHQPDSTSHSIIIKP